MAPRAVNPKKHAARRDEFIDAAQVLITAKGYEQLSIEDVLAEHLLLGRYPAGSTIEVDANADDGLVMRALEQETPVEVAAST